MLNGYYLEKAGFVDEKCAPYNLDFPKQGGCTRYKDCPTIGRVKRSYYLDLQVNKNKPDQYDIMKEIIRNGPVSADFATRDMGSLHNSKVVFKKVLVKKGPNAGLHQEVVKFGNYRSGILK